MTELLLGSWGPQLVGFIKQHPLQVTSTAVTVVSLAMILIFGIRGSGSADSGGISEGDGDGCAD